MGKRRVLLLVAFGLGAMFAAGCMQVPTKVMAYNVAANFQEAGKYTEAINKYNEFIKANPESTLIPNALFHIGDCYVKLNQKDEAVAAFQKVKDQYPASRPAQWAAQEIHRLQGP